MTANTKTKRMSKSELIAHFSKKNGMTRAEVRKMFDETTTLAEKELKRTGEFTIPGVVKLVVQKSPAEA